VAETDMVCRTTFKQPNKGGLMTDTNTQTPADPLEIDVFTDYV